MKPNLCWETSFPEWIALCSFYYTLLEHNSMAMLHKPSCNMVWLTEVNTNIYMLYDILYEYMLEQARSVVCVFLYVSKLHYTVAHCYPDSKCRPRIHLHTFDSQSADTLQRNSGAVVVVVVVSWRDYRTDQWTARKYQRSVRRAVKHHNSPCWLGASLSVMGVRSYWNARKNKWLQLTGFGAIYHIWCPQYWL